MGFLGELTGGGDSGSFIFVTINPAGVLCYMIGTFVEKVLYIALSYDYFRVLRRMKFLLLIDIFGNYTESSNQGDPSLRESIGLQLSVLPFLILFKFLVVLVILTPILQLIFSKIKFNNGVRNSCSFS